MNVFVFFFGAGGAYSSWSMAIAFRIVLVLFYTLLMAPFLALMTIDGYGLALVITLDTPNYSS